MTPPVQPDFGIGSVADQDTPSVGGHDLVLAERPARWANRMPHRCQSMVLHKGDVWCCGIVKIQSPVFEQLPDYGCGHIYGARIPPHGIPLVVFIRRHMPDLVAVRDLPLDCSARHLEETSGKAQGNNHNV